MPTSYLQARLREDCEQAARLNVSPGAVAALGEDQEPESARREARGGGGLGKVTQLKVTQLMKLRWVVRLLAYFREFGPLGGKQDQFAALNVIFGLAC